MENPCTEVCINQVNELNTTTGSCTTALKEVQTIITGLILSTHIFVEGSTMSFNSACVNTETENWQLKEENEKLKSVIERLKQEIQRIEDNRIKIGFK